MSPNQTTGGGASNGAAASFADQLRIARGARPQSAAAAKLGVCERVKEYAADLANFAMKVDEQFGGPNAQALP